MKYTEKAPTGGLQASKDASDYKFIVTATDTGNIAPTSLKIASVNDGYAVSGSGVTVSKEAIEVVGTIGGAQTRIPEDQFVVKECKNNSFTTAETNAGTKTKKATVVVQVTTWDASGNATETELTAEYEVSVEEQKVYKVTGLADVLTSTATSNTAVKAVSLQAFFKFTDQFNLKKDTTVEDILGAGKTAGNVTYNINVVKGIIAGGASIAVQDYPVTGNGTNGASVTFKQAGTYTVEITATVNGTSKKATVEYTVN